MGPSDSPQQERELKSWPSMNFDEKLDYLKAQIEQLMQMVQNQNELIHAHHHELAYHNHDDKGIPYIKQELNNKLSTIYNSSIYGGLERGR